MIFVRWQWKKVILTDCPIDRPSLSPFATFLSPSPQDSMPVLFLPNTHHSKCVHKFVCKSFIIVHEWFSSCLHNIFLSSAATTQYPLTNVLLTFFWWLAYSLARSSTYWPTHPRVRSSSCRPARVRSMTLRSMCIKDLIRVCTSVYPPSPFVKYEWPETIYQMPAFRTRTCLSFYTFVHSIHSIHLILWSDMMCVGWLASTRVGWVNL